MNILGIKLYRTDINRMPIKSQSELHIYSLVLKIKTIYLEILIFFVNGNPKLVPKSPFP